MGPKIVADRAILNLIQSSIYHKSWVLLHLKCSLSVVHQEKNNKLGSSGYKNISMGISKSPCRVSGLLLYGLTVHQAVVSEARFRLCTVQNMLLLLKILNSISHLVSFFSVLRADSKNST